MFYISLYRDRCIVCLLSYFVIHISISIFLSVEGYCRGVSAGDVRVQWNIGDCIRQGSYKQGSPLAGWTSTVRIIVEEVNVEDADTVIV